MVGRVNAPCSPRRFEFSAVTPSELTRGRTDVAVGARGGERKKESTKIVGTRKGFSIDTELKRNALLRYLPTRRLEDSSRRKSRRFARHLNSFVRDVGRTRLLRRLRDEARRQRSPSSFAREGNRDLTDEERLGEEGDVIVFPRYASISCDELNTGRCSMT